MLIIRDPKTGLIITNSKQVNSSLRNVLRQIRSINDKKID